MEIYKEKIRDIKVKSKLRLLTVFLVTSLIIIGVVAIVALDILNIQARTISKKWMPSLEVAEKMNVLTSEYRISQYAHLTTKEDSVMREYEQKLQKLEQQIEEYKGKYQELALTAEEKQLLENAQNQWEAYKRSSKEVLILSREHQKEEASEMMLKEARDFYNEFQDTYQKLVKYNENGSNAAKEKAEMTFRFIAAAILILVMTVIFIALYSSSIITKVIVEPLEEIKKTMLEIGKGNLNVCIEYQAKDEFGILAAQVNEFVEEIRSIIKDERYLLEQMAKGNFKIKSMVPEKYKGDFQPILVSIKKINQDLGNVLSHISETVLQISSASEQMADEAEALAEGATKQASTVEELAISMEEVTRQSIESEKAAAHVSEIVNSVRAEAENSNEQMNNAVNAMEIISQTSKEISSIIDSIEKIASQTNLLSLNASIESARAGEAGKGFSIVAQAIGELALNSSEAAKNTRELIEKARLQTENGNILIKNTAEKMQILTEKAKEMEENTRKVRENSKIQEASMENIKQGMEIISNVVENNAAAAEETSATSEELAANAESLKRTVDIFSF